MKYKTHNQDEKLWSLTSDLELSGDWFCDYSILKSIIGKPNKGIYKTDVEWTLQFDKNICIYLYNWKNGRNYNGKDGIPLKLMEHWNYESNSDLAIAILDYIIFNKIKPIKAYSSSDN